MDSTTGQYPMAQRNSREDSMSYAIEFQGKAVTPGGVIQVDSTSAHNKRIEAEEIEWLHTAPDKVFLYVKLPTDNGPTIASDGFRGFYAWARGDKDRGLAIQTFLGTSVATHVYVGPRTSGGLFSGYHATYKRHVTCKLFGVKYHGWYYESSGDYCRLSKAKIQK